jgi:N-acetyl-anhydromuramyl-L-alanine amidase AmpD
VSNGNSQLIGIEAENCGYINPKSPLYDPWPPHQIESYQIGVAALLRFIKQQATMCAGHKEYALPKGRKTDPTFDMTEFRVGVSRHMTDMAHEHEVALTS